MATNPTRLGSILLGIGRSTKTVLTAAVGGSIILFGSVYFDSNQNTAPSLNYGSGSFLTYQEAPITASGSNTMTANIPSSSRFASGAVLESYSVECDTKPSVMSGSVVVQTGTKQSITTGTRIRNYIILGTGSVMATSTGTRMKVHSDGYINFISASGTALKVNGNCVFKVWTHEKFGR